MIMCRLIVSWFTIRPNLLMECYKQYEHVPVFFYPYSDVVDIKHKKASAEKFSVDATFIWF